MPIFRVGRESGGREASKALDPLHDALNNAFFFNPKLGSYFRKLEFFILALRVSGKTKDFRSEGPEYLKKVRGKHLYAIDLVIPEKRWKDIPFDQLREYVMDGVPQCFELCVAKAKKDKELLDKVRLRADFEAGVQEIMSAPPEHDIFHVSRGKPIFDAMKAKALQSGEPVDEQIIMRKIEQGFFE